MTLTYIYHSGFAIECNNCSVIIDYYTDPGHEFIKKTLPSLKGKLYVLSSHWHPDHFNRAVFEWKKTRPDIQYILSKDILKKQFASLDEASFLMKGEEWVDENICVKAFGSTDVGSSFLIEANGRKIFHAGDLNNWHWDEESTPEEIKAAERHYLKEINDLANETSSLDLAMFPVDCRLGKNYMRGAEQFIDTINTKTFAPMHFGETYKEANAFQEYAEKAGTRFLKWTKTNECLTI